MTDPKREELVKRAKAALSTWDDGRVLEEVLADFHLSEQSEEAKLLAEVADDVEHAADLYMTLAEFHGSTADREAASALLTTAQHLATVVEERTMAEQKTDEQIAEELLNWMASQMCSTREVTERIAALLSEVRAAEREAVAIRLEACIDWAEFNKDNEVIKKLADVARGKAGL